ncbi:MAG: cysteine desulfurase [Alphaproteobacteria bacterium]|nr:cysteine desulfurase [Alphaproteobacteria bacterium SS10]
MSQSAIAENRVISNAYDVEAIRADFPALAQQINGKPLVYLDNGASAQKPRQVIDTMTRLLEHDYSNVHRGVHTLSQRSTEQYEALRDKAALHINAPSRENIVITRNATEAFNLVMHGFGRAHLKAGDEIIITEMEHHANIVPWQMLRTEIGIELKIAPIDDQGNFLIDEFEALLGPKTKLVSICHASNVLGTIVPAKEVVERAHARGIPVLFDGSQSAVHMPVDVQDLDCDLFIFTGHKLYGPTGIGIMYGKAEILDKMEPFQGGGDMIEQVTFAETTFKGAPYKFEAGTPPIIEGIGMAAALDYVAAIGMDAISAHEHSLMLYATERLTAIEGLTLYGQAENKAAIMSFAVDGLHSHDMGTILDRLGIAVRVGKHCAEPLMDRLGVAGTARASFGMYNTKAEIDLLAEGIEKAKMLLM